MNFSFQILIDTVLSLAENCYEAMLDIFTIFTQPMATVVNTFILTSAFPEPIGEILAIITSPITNSIFGDFSLVMFMLGGGLAVYMVWQLITWILNILT